MPERQEGLKSVCSQSATLLRVEVTGFASRTSNTFFRARMLAGCQTAQRNFSFLIKEDVVFCERAEE